MHLPVSSIGQVSLCLSSSAFSSNDKLPRVTRTQIQGETGASSGASPTQLTGATSSVDGNRINLLHRTQEVLGARLSLGSDSRSGAVAMLGPSPSWAAGDS